MLWGLPGIRHELVRLACTVLITSPLQACTPAPFILGMDPPTLSLGSAPHHVLHMVHLAYLDDMQDANV
jgi:hypothetical protein